MKPLVSIIMPVYNASKYVAEAIQSVLEQNHDNWELLIINDGSKDDSKNIIKSFSDNRIQYFEQKNAGVSAARNVGLKHMQGEYFCFLDGDDRFTSQSLSSRLDIFAQDPEVSFVDGRVLYFDATGNIENKRYVPSFKGMAFNQLLKLNSACFFGNTWMIKRDVNREYCFDLHMTHSEDLWFYIQQSQGKKYDFSTDIVLEYRQTNGTAMSNLSGLEQGYIELIKRVKKMNGVYSFDILYLKARISRIMLLSYLFDGKDLTSALLCPIHIFNA